MNKLISAMMVVPCQSTIVCGSSCEWANQENAVPRYQILGIRTWNTWARQDCRTEEIRNEALLIAPAPFGGEVVARHYWGGEASRRYTFPEVQKDGDTQKGYFRPTSSCGPAHRAEESRK
ncbi:hypothetical protein EDB83DRAFT_2554465 [Lactarius deliciosus]|nr:hypothetical protein EDB83DRAFT_2554465 [Lactarius deliciosus]